MSGAERLKDKINKAFNESWEVVNTIRQQAGWSPAKTTFWRGVP